MHVFYWPKSAQSWVAKPNRAYKYYLEILIKLMTMFFAVSGAILSYYFTKTEVETAKYALILPLLMGLGLSVLFMIGASLSKIIREDIFDLRDKLDLQVSPDLGVLTLSLIIFSIITLACTFSLAYILCFK